MLCDGVAKHIGTSDSISAMSDLMWRTLGQVRAKTFQTRGFAAARPPKWKAQAVVECAAALVGAEFANGARVLLYQHEGGSYRNFRPLRAN